MGVGVTFRMRGGINRPLIAVYVRNKDESELSKETLAELKKKQYEVTYNADMRLKIKNSTTSIESGAMIEIEKKGCEEGHKETKDKWNQSEEGHSIATLGCLVSDDYGNHYGLTCWHAIDFEVLQRNPNMDTRFKQYEENSANRVLVQLYRTDLIVRQNKQHIADFRCGQFCSTADVAALNIKRGVKAQCNPDLHAITEEDVKMIESEVKKIKSEVEKEESEAEKDESEVGSQAKADGLGREHLTLKWLFWARTLKPDLEVDMMGGISGCTSGQLIDTCLELQSLSVDELPFQRVVSVDDGQMKTQHGDSGALWVVKWEDKRVPVALFGYSTKCERYAVGHNIDDVLTALDNADPSLDVDFCYWAEPDVPCCSL